MIQIGRFTLDQFQERAVHAVRNSMSHGNWRVALVAPTGAGKTVKAMAFVDLALQKCRKVGFITSGRQLIFQTAETALEMRIPHTVMMSNSGCEFDASAAFQIISKDTLESHLKKMKDWVPPDLMIVDECDMAISPKWIKLLEQSKYVIGLTATPVTGSGKPIGFYSDTVIAANYSELISSGRLVDVPEGNVFSPYRPDLTGAKSNAGDYSPSWLSQRMNTDKLVGDVVLHWKEHADERPTVVHCVDSAHTIAVCEAFNGQGIRFEYVLQDTPQEQRDRIFSDIKRGRLYGVVNCQTLCLDKKTEILTSYGWVGYDEMSYGHEVANWDDGTITFHRPRKIVRRLTAPGEAMVSLDSKRPRRSVRVTANHTMVYRTLDKGRWHTAPASDLAGRAIRIPVNGIASPFRCTMHQPHDIDEKSKKRILNHTACNLRRRNGFGWDDSVQEAKRRTERKYSLRVKSPNELTLDECKFIGFWCGDGSWTTGGRGGKSATLSQSAAHHSITQWIDSLLELIGVDFRKRTVPPDRKSTHKSFVWLIGRGTGSGPQQRNGYFPYEPYLNKDGSYLLWGLDRPQFDAFVHGLHVADGVHGDSAKMPDGSISIFSTNHGFLSTVQAVAVCRGWRCGINKQVRRQERHSDIYTMTLTRHVEHQLARNRMQVDFTHKPEDVWCVETETGFIVTRREGTVAVVGNSRGWNLPCIEVCQLVKPTKRLRSYLQMCGRILRSSDGKDGARLIDHSGAVWRHGWPTEDRDWKADDCASIEEADQKRRTSMKEPYCCPKCSALWKTGNTCPNCGHTHRKRGQMAETHDGRLVSVKRRDAKKQTDPDEPQKVWMSILGRSANSGRSYLQASGWFRSKFGKWPEQMGITPVASPGQRRMKVCDIWPGFVRARRQK